MRLKRFAEKVSYNCHRRSLRQQMRRTVTAHEQFSNLCEPLREGAQSVPVQAAQLHHHPLNYFLLPAAEGRNERKPPRRLFLASFLRFF